MKRTLLAVAMTVALPALAMAANMTPTFDQLDTNHDSKLSKTEASASEGLDFTKADTNKDGWLDRAEFAAAMSRGSTDTAAPSNGY